MADMATHRNGDITPESEKIGAAGHLEHDHKHDMEASSAEEEDEPVNTIASNS